MSALLHSTSRHDDLGVHSPAPRAGRSPRGNHHGGGSTKMDFEDCTAVPMETGRDTRRLPRLVRPVSLPRTTSDRRHQQQFPARGLPAQSRGNRGHRRKSICLIRTTDRQRPPTYTLQLCSCTPHAVSATLSKRQDFDSLIGMLRNISGPVWAQFQRQGPASVAPEGKHGGSTVPDDLEPKCHEDASWTNQRRSADSSPPETPSRPCSSAPDQSRDSQPAAAWRSKWSPARGDRRCRSVRRAVRSVLA